MVNGECTPDNDCCRIWSIANICMELNLTAAAGLDVPASPAACNVAARLGV